MLGKASRSRFPAFPLPPFQFFPFFLPYFSGVMFFIFLSPPLLLVLSPLLPANVDDRLWGGIVECLCRVVAGRELSKALGKSRAISV